MEFLLDTVNLEEIKKSAPKDFFDHMRKVRDIIGKERTLHVQVTATNAEDMIKEAERICKEIDEDVYIKVPTSLEGIKVMKILKQKRVPYHCRCHLYNNAGLYGIRSRRRVSSTLLQSYCELGWRLHRINRKRSIQDQH